MTRELFKAYWLPIQQALSRPHEFVRHYLMKEGKILKEADVYFELKDRLANSTPHQAEAFLRICTATDVLLEFRRTRAGRGRRGGPELDRIRRLKVTVAYPFLLSVFDSLTTALY